MPEPNMVFIVRCYDDRIEAATVEREGDGMVTSGLRVLDQPETELIQPVLSILTGEYDMRRNGD